MGLRGLVWHLRVLDIHSNASQYFPKQYYDRRLVIVLEDDAPTSKPQDVALQFLHDVAVVVNAIAQSACRLSLAFHVHVFGQELVHRIDRDPLTEDVIAILALAFGWEFTFFPLPDLSGNKKDLPNIGTYTHGILTRSAPKVFEVVTRM